MEVIYSSETSVGFQRTIRRYIPEDSSLQELHVLGLKSYKGTQMIKNDTINAHKILVGGGRDRSGNLGGGIISTWMLKK
jgi:hypothetical protein